MSCATATIVADVGGTHSRLAVALNGELSHLQRYRNADFDDFDSCLGHYCEHLRTIKRPDTVRLALAAPIIDDQATLTNLAWTVSCAKLKQMFSFAQVELLNDFAALALSIPALAAADLVALGRGTAVDAAPCLVLGPGTGFGAAILLPSGEVIATEAGHGLLGAVNEAERLLLKRLAFDDKPVSIENVLSGAGLLRLYATFEQAGRGSLVSMETFVDAYNQGASTAQSALSSFFAFLGIAARDLALATGARGGVYIAGGILPRYADVLVDSLFRERFETATPLHGYLESIPCYLVTHETPALLGLARQSGS